jgi:hypothetical protein
MKSCPFSRWLVIAAVAALAPFAMAGPAILDAVTFGDASSEANHAVVGDHSSIMTGGLGATARKLLALEGTNWQGGRVAFTLKADPDRQNYATVRLWGSDRTDNELTLFCEGKQIGYRHLGDIDLLDFGGGEAAFPGRFFYTTTPLPLAMTRGRTNLDFEIRSSGPTWGYADSFAQYQKPMTEPSRGIYAIYSHTNGFFAPPAGDPQGLAPANPPVREQPGPEVLDNLKSRVNGEVNHLLSARSLNQMEVEFLARAWSVTWTAAHHNDQAVAQVLKGLDGTFEKYCENPRLAESDPATPNASWFGLGPSGDALRLLAEPLKPFFDGEIAEGTNQITRRAAYTEMLVACRDWHRQNRRLYSNQTMINDLYGIYLANRGIGVLTPERALSEPAARRYLYESLALEPWRDSDPGADSHRWGVGTNYWELTAKGLTKELGYVGYYGEVLDWVTSIYEATRPAPGQPGDGRIKAQLEKIAHARGVFRYPGTDADGDRAMRIETIVGWRDEGHYPGNVAYGERPTWDASSLYAVSATLDPEAIGYAQQMFADGQYFISLERQMQQANNLRVTAGLLEAPDEYDLIKAQPPSAARLPMTPGRPDFVFTDEEDGVVAIKNGDEMLYASLYWRARQAVNFLARIHDTTPQMDRIAVVQEDVDFQPSGMTYTRPDWINFGFGNGGPKYPVAMHSANAGEILPIAKMPGGVKFKPGDESVYAGKGDFYTLRYGNYLIGMNLTTDRTFELKTPAGGREAKELVSGKTVTLNVPLKVGPRSTVVLWRPAGTEP